MSELLTKQEYSEIAKKITLPNKAFINGQFVDAQSGQTMPSENPATGEVLTEIASCDASDVNIAVANAKTVYESGVWSALSPAERKTAVLKLADLIEEHALELAVLETLEAGKPIHECVKTDLPETISCIRWYAEAADKMYDQISPTANNALATIRREAVGVVACVLPWNFPLMMLAWKLGPALVMGNSVIIKPAESTSMTTLKVAELAIKAGIPAGVFNVLPGLGPNVGEPLGLHEDVQVISFTGSTATGRRFLKYSADSNLKRVVLECGGKSPSVVLSDADNLDSVAENIVAAGLWNMGQNCTANSRIIIHKDLKVELTKKIIAKLDDWRTGDPLDPQYMLGSVINRQQYDKVLGYIEIGKKEGAKVIFGGNAIELNNGLFIEPTIFDSVTPDMTIAKEEIFGPVFGLIEAESDEEAIAIANDTCYGLQASLYTRDLKKAHLYSQQLKAGTVSVNCFSEGDITTPFGGYKLSGFGGRDNSLMAFDQYSEVKATWFDFS
ncbi:aldehyde dehydrogenase [Thalassotalea piscium]|uniref:Gamma-glutamyl-gamma-aminobutyraldehyde dehydrogenase n=1 Tax=Thalassotalea piscium TaxID=1230533 RepID=A0A7X0NHQ5_9GAMM|nr:aldehyde dehydrogenase [Thalassotalea piscium]MBB6543593.1 gamma-glutamyl-gamma-aminobutyraldehyde dehydrogenase [Thalassotalea piscium]